MPTEAKQTQQSKSTKDVDSLARQIFVQLLTSNFASGKTPAFLAGEAHRYAEAFIDATKRSK